MKPEEIGFLTYSKSATEELRQRLGLPRNTNSVTTIHAMCFRAGGYNRTQVIGTETLAEFAGMVGLTLKPASRFEVGLKDILALRSKANNKLTTISEEATIAQLPCSMDFVIAIDEAYKNFCDAMGLLDFDAMLKSYISSPVFPQWKHLFIDEGQDLSRLQWQVIRAMLSSGHIEQVYLAGDDDQSVNEFAGAEPHGMSDFGNEFNSKSTVLSQSWRIPFEVHQLAETIIGRVKQRVPKKYLPRSEHGIIVRSSQFDTSGIDKGTLILCRSSATRDEITQALRKHLIPYVIDGDYRGPYFSPLGIAIKSFRRLQQGEALTMNEFNQMGRYMTQMAGGLLKEAKYAQICSMDVGSVFQLNENNWDFYTNADMLAPPKVRISSIHASKGREAEHVMVCTGLTERIMVNSMAPAGSDAEHRVWYVAVTRARSKLTLFGSNNSAEEYRFD